MHSLFVLAQLPPADPVLAEPSTPIGTFYVLMLGLVCAGVLALTAAGAKWFLSRSTLSKADGFYAVLVQTAHAIVAHMDATLRPTLASVLRDGKLSREDAVLIKTAALKSLKEALGEHGLKLVTSLLGVAAPKVEEFLSGRIELALSAQKAPGAATPVIPVPALPPMAFGVPAPSPGPILPP